MSHIKPGDLCVVVRVTRECDRPYIGSFLTAVQRDKDGDAWETEPELQSLDDPACVVCWYDGELQPIRGQRPSTTTTTAEPVDGIAFA